MDAVDELGLDRVQEAHLRRLLFRGGWLIDEQALLSPRARSGALEVQFVDRPDGGLAVATQNGDNALVVDARDAASIFDALSAVTSS